MREQPGASRIKWGKRNRVRTLPVLSIPSKQRGFWLFYFKLVFLSKLAPCPPACDLQPYQLFIELWQPEGLYVYLPLEMLSALLKFERLGGSANSLFFRSVHSQSFPLPNESLSSSKKHHVKRLLIADGPLYALGTRSALAEIHRSDWRSDERAGALICQENGHDTIFARHRMEGGERLNLLGE